MDSNAATLDDATKQLPAEQTAVGEKEDIISKLHENILGYILSFLPTVEAVSTSVLSRRWVDIWKSITSLQFDDSSLRYGKNMQQEQFVNFVNRVLHHLANSNIHSFSLCLTRYHYDASQVSEWISFILERGVQKLHIQYAETVILSSHSIFSCSSLVELKLQMRCTLSVPISSRLRNLQKLSISGIRLESDSSTYSKDIILSFPVLKVFEARVCEWSTMQNICINAPLLERFSIAIWNSLSNESCRPAIKISSPHLKDFSYEGDLAQEIILLEPSSFHSASIVIVIDEDKKERMKKHGFQAHQLLQQIHEVERLKLLFYKVLIHAKDIFTQLPAFGRLTYLQLNEVTGEALLKLLHNSPNLSTLVLHNGVAELSKDILSSASVPHCIVSSIKVFHFKGFNVRDNELYLVKFMMENATTLERMAISTAFWLRYSDIDMEKVKEQIFSFPKCSNSAMIEFSDINGS